MIIKASKCDREYLNEQLLKLIKQNKSELSLASDDEICSGLATFSEDFSVNRALMKRAIENIRNAVATRIYADKHESLVLMQVGNEYLERLDEEQKMDSIGPELLDDNMEDHIPF